MLKELPEEEFGSGVDIREYSILDNPSLPSEVNKFHFHPHLKLWILLSCCISFTKLMPGVLTFRWRCHGLMFSSVRMEPKIVLHQIIPLLGEYSNFQGIAMKKRYFKLDAFNGYFSSRLLSSSKSIPYKVHWYDYDNLCVSDLFWLYQVYFINLH